MNRQLMPTALLIALMIPLSGCVSDGVDGTQGEGYTPGENGIDGTNGLNGTDGLDGIDKINEYQSSTHLAIHNHCTDEEQLCPEGGIMLMFGTDDDGSGELEEDGDDNDYSIALLLPAVSITFHLRVYLQATILFPMMQYWILAIFNDKMNQSIATGNCLENDSWLREDGATLFKQWKPPGKIPTLAMLEIISRKWSL